MLRTLSHEIGEKGFKLGEKSRGSGETEKKYSQHYVHVKDGCHGLRHGIVLDGKDVPHEKPQQKGGAQYLRQKLPSLSLSDTPPDVVGGASVGGISARFNGKGL